jgi:peroxin-14
MIEKHAASQTAALNDLQSELRSLKTLLQSRQPATPANGTGTGRNVSATTAAANALLTPKGRGIPAWQMASGSASTAGEDKGAGGGGGGSGSGQTSPGSSLEGSAVVVEGEAP